MRFRALEILCRSAFSTPCDVASAAMQQMRRPPAIAVVVAIAVMVGLLGIGAIAGA